MRHVFSPQMSIGQIGIADIQIDVLQSATGYLPRRNVLMRRHVGQFTQNVSDWVNTPSGAGSIYPVATF